MTRRLVDRRGFSLLDALATLTLVAIVGTIAVPVVNRYVDASRLRATAWTLARDLHRTRAQAIRENRPQRLTLSVAEVDPETGNPTAYSIAPADGTGTPERHPLPPGIECRNVPGSWVEFDARGLARGESMELVLGGTGDGTAKVRVRSTGRVDFPG